MPKLLEQYTPLRNIRKEKGLSAQEVARLLVAKINDMGWPETEKTYAWVLRFEERGTTNHYIIKGLADIYGVPEDAVAAAANPSKIIE